MSVTAEPLNLSATGKSHFWPRIVVAAAAIVVVAGAVALLAWWLAPAAAPPVRNPFGMGLR